MRQLLVILFFLMNITNFNQHAFAQASSQKAFCNPLDISYRFCIDEPSRREAADPTVTWFRDRYYLFASKSGGYWHSMDLADWIFIETTQIPVEEYAPTVIAIADTLYFLASSNERSTIYKSHDPLSGLWEVAVPELEMPVWDPALFLDDDGKLYLYWGCSNEKPIYGVELDYRDQFSFVGEPKVLINAHPEAYGWEVPGDYNTLIHQKPWIEGAWLNKIKGKYYLQYSGPGTEFKSYSDGVYIASQPLGPFTLQQHNPFAYKPEGFAAGAGHGSTFSDRYGNFWHIGTMTISQKHIFERRLGLFPAFLDDEGTFYTQTKFGDYPLSIPQKKIHDFDEIFPGWMLLSFRKQVTVSSALDSFPASNMTDENIRTYWAAESGEAGEYAIMDLGEKYDVFAIQVNFAEHNTHIYGRKEGLHHRYTIEASNDKVHWEMLSDKSLNNHDNTHNFYQLEEKMACRYIRVKNVEIPDGNFAISELRVFGMGQGKIPGKIKDVELIRNENDRRKVRLTWSGTNATGYHILFGTDKDKLYNCYTVLDTNELELNSLNAEEAYFFKIEAFNESGIRK